MKKKLLLSVLVILGLFIMTGCGSNSNNSTNNSTNSTDGKEDSSSIKVGNVSVNLTQSASFHDISYKYPENAQYSNVGDFTIIDLMNGENLVVRIGLYFYENKTMGEVNAGEGLSSVDAIEYNNNTWNVYEGEKDGKKIMNYATQENDDSYTITFISDEDLTTFSNELMKTVIFNR